jgi:hypothetical protein
MGGGSTSGNSLGGGYASIPGLQSQQQPNIWGNAISTGAQQLGAGFSGSQLPTVNYASPTAVNTMSSDPNAPGGLIPTPQQDLIEIIQRILAISGGSGGYG